MPLYDSLGASQQVRLPQMTSVPTTDDLRYLVSEARKRQGKPVELPFEHPVNRNIFIVKLVISVGNRVPPSWTLIRGDGAGAKIVWNRSGEDVMIIHNKIKTDSAYGTQTEMEAPVHSAPGGDIPISGALGMWNGQVQSDTPAGDPDDPFSGLAQAPSFLQPPSFMKQPSAPAAPADDSSSIRVSQGEAPPSSDAINEMLPPIPNDDEFENIPGVQPFPRAQPAAMAQPTAIAQPAQSAQPSASAQPDQFEAPPLPPPIQLDRTMIQHVRGALSNPATGLAAFPTFVYFLFREFDRFQKDTSPMAVLVFELALMFGKDVSPLPEQAVQAVAQRILPILSPLDIATHLGGGEFAVLLPGTYTVTAADFATELKLGITDGPLIQDELVLAAVGCAGIPETCGDPEVLLAAARAAKEMAKGKGDPCIIYPVAPPSMQW